MLKKLVTLNAAFLVLIGTMAYMVSANGKDASKGKEGMIVGEVIDLVNYGMFDRKGEEHREAGLYRAKGGFPIGILEEDTGKVFVAVYRLPVPAAGMQTANAVLMPFMGRKVAAQGLIFRGEELNVVRLSLVNEY